MPLFGRTPKPSQASHDRQAYIPPHIEQAMAKQMQQSMPAHMKKYVGPYMQQKVMNQSFSPTSGSASPAHVPTYKPVTHLPREDHFHQYPDSRSVGASPSSPGTLNSPSAADMTSTAPVSELPPNPNTTPPAQLPSNEPDYDFIMNPTRHGGGSSGTASGMPSKLKKVFIVASVAVLLIIGFGVLRTVLSNNPSMQNFLSVAQDQQQLIHIASGALEQQGLDKTNTNSALTAQLSVTSDQSDTITYMRTNGKKVNAKQLNLKVSSSTDNELSTAASQNNYNQAYKQAMKEKLAAYQRDLKLAYASAGQNGKKLLSAQYESAGLLIVQLDTLAN